LHQTCGLTLERTLVPRLTDLWGPARSRKANFSARLPTRLPGIAFTARGHAWFRQDPSKYAVLPLRTARAAALAGVYEIAKARAEKFDPEAAFHAEQATAVHLTDWQPLEKSPVEVRATLAFDLTGEDAAKAERFTESLRGARLDEALAREHIEFLREIALKDEDTARLWWLHCNLTGGSPDTSWTAFTDIVRPLIRQADENDPVTRLVRALLTMNDYYQADPDRLKNLADLTAFAAKKVSDDEIARTLATLSQPTQANQSGTNGAIPPGP
jgi:hypothetical protein